MADMLDWTDARETELQVEAHLNRAGEAASWFREEVSAGRFPFCAMPYADGLLDDLDRLAPYLKKFEHMLVLGIGGSALGARALQKAFASGQDLPGHAGPWLWIADNVDAYAMEAYLTRLPAEKTVVVVISKSGGTIETIGQYFLVRDWLEAALGAGWAEHIFLITDEAKGFLREEAVRLGAPSLPVPDHLGGRYSVLSAVGLVPAAFLGMDCRALVAGARAVLAPLAAPDLDGRRLAGHPSFQLAAWANALMDRGYLELIFFCYMPQWAWFGQWFAQLWAESLGKEGKGSQPLPAVGVTDQHSVNQMFLDGPRNKACLFVDCPSLPDGRRFPAALPAKFSYVAGKPFGELLQAEGLGTRMALVKSGAPLVEASLSGDGPFQAGKLMGLCMAATVLTGRLMGINPIDQPAVELGKRLATARLGADGLAPEKADLAAFLSGDRDLRGF